MQTVSHGSAVRPRLVVFMTRGMSLEQWRRRGVLDRELAVYRALAPRAGSVAFLSYGGREDQAPASRLDGLNGAAILVNQWHLPATLYSVLAPVLHAAAIRRATLLRTHQLNGAWCAAIAKRLFRKPLIVRCGYLWSDFFKQEHGATWKQPWVERMEGWALRAADRIVVATEGDRRRLAARYGLPLSRIVVIPNAVETGRFRPMPDVPKVLGLLCCVAKCEEQKNVFALLEALRGLPQVRLQVVGDGSLRPSLERYAQVHRLPVEWMGTVPNDRLPAILNRAQAFVLPSRYEGHPKALLEAMACGLPVIGTDVPGIREVIAHRQTGYLCGTAPEAIRAAIQDVLGDAPLAQRMAANARTDVVRECALETIVQQELALLADV